MHPVLFTPGECEIITLEGRKGSQPDGQELRCPVEVHHLFTPGSIFKRMVFALPLVFFLPFMLLKSQPGRINSLLPCSHFCMSHSSFAPGIGSGGFTLGALGAEKKRDLGIFRQNKEWLWEQGMPKEALPWVM